MRTIEEIFLDRTCYKFTDKQVDVNLLNKIYDLMKLGPTASNCCPLRIVFVNSKKQKEKLENCVMEGNKAKVRSASVVALFAYDPLFYKKMDKTNPISPEINSYFASSALIAEDTAFRNSALQAAYFIIIARAFGLDCGPMSGFDNSMIEKEFLSESGFKINFICNLGYRAEPNPYPRLPRLDFDETCLVI